MMNNLPKTLCKGLAAVALMGVASSAFATDSVTLNVGPYGDLGGYGGGEFTAVGSGLSTSSYAATTSSGGSFGSFETFCMAYTEEFVPGNWGGPPYTYFLSNNTFSNTPPYPASDTLTQGTAWLYSQFAAGKLSGYDYTSANRAASARDLQEAIWSLQGTYGVPSYLFPSSTNPFMADVIGAFGSLDPKTPASLGYDGVYIMVLNGWSGYGTTPFAQPQLYYNVPDNGTTGLLVAGALVALLGFRRRFKNV